MIQIAKKSLLSALVVLFPMILSAHDGGHQDGHAGAGANRELGRSAAQTPTPQWNSRNFRENTNPNINRSGHINKEYVNNNWRGGYNQRNWHGHHDDWDHHRNTYYHNNYYYSPYPYPYYYNAYPAYYNSAYYDPYYYETYPYNDYYYNSSSNDVGAGLYFQIGG